jgi:uncharacterized membrane protein
MADGIQSSHLTIAEETILARLREIDPARTAITSLSLAATQRVADRIAAAIGSWRFILFQTIFLALGLSSTLSDTSYPGIHTPFSCSL